MLVVVGSYEQMLLGYNISQVAYDDPSTARFLKFYQEEGALKHDATFTDHSHSGCIKTITSSARILASGSTDERIW